MIGGIDQQVQQRVDKHRQNPQGLMQKYQQDSQRGGGVGGDLLDLLAMQKITTEKQRAARELQMAQQNNPATIKQQREQEVLGLTKDEIAKQLGGTLQNQQVRSQQAQQAAAKPPAPQVPGPMGGQGIAGAAVPIQKMSGGGIVGFAGPEGSSVPRMERPEFTSGTINILKGQLVDLAKLLTNLDPESARAKNIVKEIGEKKKEVAKLEAAVASGGVDLGPLANAPATSTSPVTTNMSITEPEPEPEQGIGGLTGASRGNAINNPASRVAPTNAPAPQMPPSQAAVSTKADIDYLLPDGMPQIDTTLPARNPEVDKAWNANEKAADIDIAGLSDQFADKAIGRVDERVDQKQVDADNLMRRQHLMSLMDPKKQAMARRIAGFSSYARDGGLGGIDGGFALMQQQGKNNNDRIKELQAMSQGEREYQTGVAGQGNLAANTALPVYGDMKRAGLNNMEGIASTLTNSDANKYMAQLQAENNNVTNSTESKLVGTLQDNIKRDTASEFSAPARIDSLDKSINDLAIKISEIQSKGGAEAKKYITLLKQMVILKKDSSEAKRLQAALDEAKTELEAKYGFNGTDIAYMVRELEELRRRRKDMTTGSKGQVGNQKVDSYAGALDVRDVTAQ